MLKYVYKRTLEIIANTLGMFEKHSFDTWLSFADSFAEFENPPKFSNDPHFGRFLAV